MLRTFALLGTAIGLTFTIAGCPSTKAIPKSPIAQLSPTERQLLAAETKPFERVLDAEATIERWCLAEDDQMLNQLVEQLKAGNIQELSVVAIGFRRVCGNRRIYFHDALKKAESPDNAKVVDAIGRLAYGI